jgi:hypothetical protein
MRLALSRGGVRRAVGRLPGNARDLYWGSGICDDVPALSWFLTIALVPLALGMTALASLALGDYAEAQAVAVVIVLVVLAASKITGLRTRLGLDSVAVQLSVSLVALAATAAVCDGFTASPRVTGSAGVQHAPVRCRPRSRSS